MKQKRKVKSLLPQKNFVKGKILTILLVVLSLLLCIGGVSLLTNSVSAADGKVLVTIYYYYYTIKSADGCVPQYYFYTANTFKYSVGAEINITPNTTLLGWGYTGGYVAYGDYTGENFLYTVQSSGNDINLYHVWNHQSTDSNGNQVPDKGEPWFRVKVHYKYGSGRINLTATGSHDESVRNNVIYSISGIIDENSDGILDNAFECYHPVPEVITGRVNCGNDDITFRYVPNAGRDSNNDGVCDDDEVTVTVHHVYHTHLNGNDQVPIGDDTKELHRKEDTYQIYQLPETSGFYTTTPEVVSGKLNRTSVVKWMKYYPIHDSCNQNGIADELEKRRVTINYTCKIKNKTGEQYACDVPQHVGEYGLTVTFDTPVPQVPGYSNVEPDKPVIEGSCENDQIIDVVLTLSGPEKDQNNDGIWDGAQELWEVTEFDYTGLDNKVEVLYGMRFLDPTDFTKVVNSIYMSGSVLYIAPNPVVVGSTNQVSDNVYSHILGGENNEVSSNNITLIAGSNNKVHAWNDNASILGGSGNEVMPGKNGGVSAIIVGGESNLMGAEHDGNALIGGKKNKIEDGHSNVFILGGENNKILGQDAEGHSTHSKNVIIGGKNVHIEGIDNIFVYSSKGNYYDYFSPVTQNAFYLNIESGAGINTDGIEGLSVGGAVSVGRVNINNTNILCNNTNLGVVGSYSGCLVGCTKAGLKAGGKWEMLDQGNECAEICQNNSDHCLNQEDEVINVEDSDAQCTEGVVNTDNAHLCIHDLESYKNVIFESSLIDSDEECPNGQNICVYQCDEGFNLKQDPLNGNKRGCYGECELPWDPTQKIQHGVTITGYNVENVSCSNDVYVFPLESEIINLGQPKFNYTKKDITKNGITYKNRAKNGKSYESCGNYDHKKTLICYKGTLYLTKNDGKPDTNTAEAAKKYNRESCDLHNYRCDTGETGYNLTQQQIESDKIDGPLNNGSREVADRGTLTGNRGLYDVCIDFDADPSDPSKNGEKCNTGTYHYKFNGCKDGYFLGDDGICRKDCSLNDKNGNPKPYHSNDEVVGYQVTSTQCPDECTGSKLVCDEGLWHIGSKTGSLATGTWYNYCNGGEKTCGSEFNVNQIEHDQYVSVSFYADCVNYNVSNNICTTGDTMYKLTGCVENYHANENMKWCVSNTQTKECSPKKPDNSHYTTSGTTNDGKYQQIWSGNWKLGEWVDKYENPCDWDCDTNYVKEGNSCRKLEPACDEPNYSCIDATKEGKNNPGDGSGSVWKCDDKWCARCDEETSYRTGSESTLGCYKNKNENVNGKCGTVAYECEAGDHYDRDESSTQYNWDCLGRGSGMADTGCYECKLNASWSDAAGKCVCDTGFHVEGMECRKDAYTCGEILEDVYKCLGNSGDWVRGTYTGYSNDEYTWMCGDTACSLPSDDINDESYQICRELSYSTWTFNSLYHGIIDVSSLYSVKFWSVDRRTLPVPVIISQNLKYRGKKDSDGVWTYISDSSDCEEIEVINTGAFVSQTQTPKGALGGPVQSCFDRLGAGGNVNYYTYWDLNGDPEVMSRHDIDFVTGFDCLEPKCGNIEKSCSVGFVSGYNASSHRRSCIYGSNSIGCEYSCRNTCPDGYSPSGSKCVLDAKYCAEPYYSILGCSMYSWTYGNLYSATCCGTDKGSLHGTIAFNFPRHLYKNSLCGIDVFSDVDGANDPSGTPYTNLRKIEPKYESDSLLCNDSPSLEDILENCYSNLEHYPKGSDNGYVIQNCNNNENIPETVNRCESAKCRVYSLVN